MQVRWQQTACDLAGLKTADEVLAMIRKELGDAAAGVSRPNGHEAEVVQVTIGGGHEASALIARIRPAVKNKG
jgi:hypothetical protein